LIAGRGGLLRINCRSPPRRAIIRRLRRCSHKIATRTGYICVDFYKPAGLIEMNNVTRICSFLILVGSLTSCAAPPVVESEPSQTMPVQGPLRPPVIGRNAGVSAGHPLTTAAALEILQQGGNAFDAGVAALLVGGVVEQDLYGIGGEALILVYPQSDGKVATEGPCRGRGWIPQSCLVRCMRHSPFWNAGER
jgi:hypothetical protein